MTDMPQMLALAILLAILFIGDVLSTRTKAVVPSVFVCAVLFLLGYWTFFPKDIVQIAGVSSAVATMLMYLLIVNMGTLLSMKEFLEQWKTVLISLASIVGVVVVCFSVGVFIFDWNTIVVAIPPLVGGIVSTMLMAEGAVNNGFDSLAVLAILIYVMLGFCGYPLTSYFLKKEGEEVLAKYRKGEWTADEEEPHNNGTEKTVSRDDFPQMFKGMPQKYNTSYFQLARIAFVGMLAFYTSKLLGPVVAVHPLVLCLLFGVIASYIGFLEKHPLQKANAFGFAVMGLMLFIFDTLKRATPEMLIDLVTPLLILIVMAVVGLYVFSTLAAKFLKTSRKMGFCIALTAFYGFPADYIITNEVINLLTTDTKERKVLNSHMLGSMLIGGFVSVTMVSVVLAGFMVTLIRPA